MKINNLLILVFAIITVSCHDLTLVPKVVDFGENVRGAQIKLDFYQGKSISGELLASSDSMVSILKTGTEIPSNVAYKSVKSFTIQYAKSGISPLYGIYSAGITALHGRLAVFTLPITALFIGLSYVDANSDYKLTSNEITFDGLSTYARFPQGLPSAYKTF